MVISYLIDRIQAVEGTQTVPARDEHVDTLR
jgi:hypothetical protein